jgi:transcriptional regulator with XRE-family HTH domain
MSTETTIGERLREERDRLLLSQHMFASKAGVSRMSQVNYESGKRSPDANYLKEVAAAGVDVAYVITGARRLPPDFYRMAASYVLENIEARTGLAEDILVFVIDVLAENAAFAWMDASKDEQASVQVKWDMTQWIDGEYLDFLIKALFENAVLLRDIFASVNSEFLVDPGKTSCRLLTGDKRLALVVMLYRAFREAGKVDLDVVSEAVKLVDPELARQKIILEVEARTKKAQQG